MYKISDEVINFIKKTMKTWRVELLAGGRTLAEANIQRGIFQGDALSPLLFIIAMMPLNHILRKCTAEYKLSISKEKNQSPNVRHQTIYKKMKKNWKLLYTQLEYIQSGHRNGIWHRKICYASNEKCQRTSN